MPGPSSAVSVGLFAAVLSMDEFTTPEPKTTTQEDTSGRLLTLPVPEKCANSEWRCPDCGGEGVAFFLPICTVHCIYVHLLS